MTKCECGNVDQRSLKRAFQKRDKKIVELTNKSEAVTTEKEMLKRKFYELKNENIMMKDKIENDDRILGKSSLNALN